MKERPILFSGAMVRALLDGSKTQTRRIVKPQPTDPVTNRQEWLSLRRPYGQTGDRLWVKETWRTYASYDQESMAVMQLRLAIAQRQMCKVFPVQYEADKSQRNWHADEATPGKLRPSIFMPRWASRISVEITGVRVERLQDISQADAQAEGAPPSHPSIDRISRQFGFADFPRSWYAQLWEQINGAGSWEANPWVWAVEFRRVGTP